MSKATKTTIRKRVRPPKTTTTEASQENKDTYPPPPADEEVQYPTEHIPSFQFCLNRRNLADTLIREIEASLHRLRCERDLWQTRLQFRQRELENMTYNPGICCGQAPTSVGCR